MIHVCSAVELQRMAVVALTLAPLLLSTARARANPRPLPFSYNHDTLEQGEVVLEQSIDARSPIVIDEDGHRSWDPQFRLQFEYVYGITDRLEFGVSVVLASAAGQAVYVEGMKQRLHGKLSPKEWPIDVGFNLELVEFRSAFAIEERVILQKRWSHLQLIANSSLSQEFERYRGSITWIVDQTLGAAVPFGEHVQLGAEYWMRMGVARKEGEEGDEFEGEDEIEVVEADPDVGFETLHFVGPCLTLQWHRFWWTTAAYLRIDDFGPVMDVETSRLTPDPYGRVWVRSLIGLML